MRRSLAHLRADHRQSQPAISTTSCTVVRRVRPGVGAVEELLRHRRTDAHGQLRKKKASTGTYRLLDRMRWWKPGRPTALPVDTRSPPTASARARARSRTERRIPARGETATNDDPGLVRPGSRQAAPTPSDSRRHRKMSNAGSSSASTIVSSPRPTPADLRGPGASEANVPRSPKRGPSPRVRRRPRGQRRARGGPSRGRWDQRSVRPASGGTLS